MNKWSKQVLLPQRPLGHRLQALKNPGYDATQHYLRNFSGCVVLHNRLLVAVVLLVMLVIGTSLSARLPHTRAAFLSQSVTRGISQNERKLVKSSWKGEPLHVNTVKRRGNTTEFGKAFTDPDDDWLKGFSLNVTNRSNKDIVFIELSLTFFSKEKKPGRTPLEYPVFYGSPEGIFDGSTSAHPIRPNESAEVTLRDEEYEQMKYLFVNNNYPTVFHTVELRLDRVVFADGLIWYKGYHFYRDPSNPHRFIRDKSFEKGEKRENVRPGTALIPTRGFLLNVVSSVNALVEDGCSDTGCNRPAAQCSTP